MKKYTITNSSGFDSVAIVVVRGNRQYRCFNDMLKRMLDLHASCDVYNVSTSGDSGPEYWWGYRACNGPVRINHETEPTTTLAVLFNADDIRLDVIHSQTRLDDNGRVYEYLKVESLCDKIAADFSNASCMVYNTQCRNEIEIEVGEVQAD